MAVASGASPASWLPATAWSPLATMLPLSDRAAQPLYMSFYHSSWGQWLAVSTMMVTKVVIGHLHLDMKLHLGRCPSGVSPSFPLWLGGTLPTPEAFLQRFQNLHADFFHSICRTRNFPRPSFQLVYFVVQGYGLFLGNFLGQQLQGGNEIHCSHFLKNTHFLWGYTMQWCHYLILTSTTRSTWQTMHILLSKSFIIIGQVSALTHSLSF